MTKVPTPDISLVLNRWPPTIEDLRAAFETAEEWSKVSNVVLNEGDFEEIDFHGCVIRKGRNTSLWGATLSVVDDSFGSVHITTDRVKKRGPKYGDPVLVVLSAPRA